MSDDHDDEIPNFGYYNGEPIPDLHRIPRERWEEVLRPLSDSTLFLVPSRNGGAGDLEGMLRIIGHIKLNRPSKRRTPPLPGPPPAGRIDDDELERMQRPGARSRQVNLRLGRDVHEQLCEIAGELGLRPTQLARLLVTNGLRRYAYEERRLSGP